ncbi:Myosin type-2 heavy chain 1 [Mycoemilia scoparia]|uniref:Myosin type-2 heavy chain 1 n=1 Tax=Mycoemilia scoparia TaxID=417184 RepID=A0A9W8DTS4_9FUNG|nr:Myosin type-2 heavy chain 1 [Mycoemilia scoparia]
MAQRSQSPFLGTHDWDALKAYTKDVHAWFQLDCESGWFTAILVDKIIDEKVNLIRMEFKRNVSDTVFEKSLLAKESNDLYDTSSFSGIHTGSATITPTHSPVKTKPKPGAFDHLSQSPTISGLEWDDDGYIIFEATFDEVFEKKTKELPYLRNPSALEGVEDLTNLSYLHEPAILYNLQERYRRNEIYTYSGVVLVAINPFDSIPLYTEKIMKWYAGKRRSERPPHLFAIAEDAYHGMVSDGKNQTIIVYGESGAGKTTSAKYIMRYYAQAHHAETNGSSMTRVEQQILATNPVLESFGNAKTVNNDNSSRFGKYIEIKFGKDRCSIVGAWIRTFLLERSRVVYQPEMERNYHVFYQLLASSGIDNIKEPLGLGNKTASDFNYLIQGGEKGRQINGVNDATEFKATRDALALVGIDEAKQKDIWRVLAALLHLGNVTITSSTTKGVASCKEDYSFEKATELLGVDSQKFRQWLTKKQIVTRKDSIQTNINATQSMVVRDSIAKFIYARLFDWIIRPINESLLPADAAAEATTFIGVLDIYGFEYSEKNSFEQFCINFANEKLQQHFNHHVFKVEQQEYMREKLQNWKFIDFKDNQPCIDLIEGKPVSILSILDEESRLDTGTDRSFTEKLFSQFSSNSNQSISAPKKSRANAILSSIGSNRNKTPPSNTTFGNPTTNHTVNSFFTRPRFSNQAFAVKHYACEVTYDSEGFLEKNRDTVPDEIMELLRKSSFSMVSSLVDVDVMDQSTSGYASKDLEVHAPNQDLPKASGRMNKVRSIFETHDNIFGDTSSFRSSYASGDLVGPGRQRKSAPTLATKFKHSLKHLMSTLAATDMHYIRCIKPNSSKEKWCFEPNMVLNQLRSCGVLETIRISKAGYPSRMPIQAFNERYSLLMDAKVSQIARERRKPEARINGWGDNDAKLVGSRQRKMSVTSDGKAWERFNTRKSVIMNKGFSLEDLTISQMSISQTTDEDRDTCAKIAAMFLDKSEDRYQIGLTKIFFRAGQWAVMENLRTDLITKTAITIQKNIRAYKARTQFQAYKEAALKIQRWYRTVTLWSRLRKIGRDNAASKIQRQWLLYKENQRYFEACDTIQILQTACRFVLAKSDVLQLCRSPSNKQPALTIASRMESTSLKNKVSGIPEFIKYNTSDKSHIENSVSDSDSGFAEKYNLSSLRDNGAHTNIQESQTVAKNSKRFGFRKDIPNSGYRTWNNNCHNNNSVVRDVKDNSGDRQEAFSASHPDRKIRQPKRISASPKPGHVPQNNEHHSQQQFQFTNPQGSDYGVENPLELITIAKRRQVVEDARRNLLRACNQSSPYHKPHMIPSAAEVCVSSSYQRTSEAKCSNGSIKSPTSSIGSPEPNDLESSPGNNISNSYFLTRTGYMSISPNAAPRRRRFSRGNANGTNMNRKESPLLKKSPKLRQQQLDAELASFDEHNGNASDHSTHSNTDQLYKKNLYRLPSRLPFFTQNTDIVRANRHSLFQIAHSHSSSTNSTNSNESVGSRLQRSSACLTKADIGSISPKQNTPSIFANK